MPEARLQRLPDWIVLGQEQWDRVERRNQLLVRALSRRNPSSRFLFVEIPLRPREFRDWRWPSVRRVADGVWAFRPIRPIPDSVASGIADRLECAQIARAARTLGLERPFLWTQDPRAATLIEHLPAQRVVYDLTDDWAAFESDAGARAAVQRRIESVAKRSHVVFACSRALEEGAHDWSPEVVYLPNAVEPAESLDRDRGRPSELAELARPIVGYAGTLHASRVDIDLVIDAARLRPDWSFVFLGPNLLGPSDAERLREVANIHDLGVRDHSLVASYLESFDVCLLPNLVTDFTRSLDPLKLYEYLAAGRPVVSTPVDNAPDLAEHIEIASTAEELIARTESALSRDSDRARAERRAAVAGETWDARAAVVEEVLGVHAAGPPTTDEVSVVIVSFNTRELLRRCLTELEAEEVPLQKIVVDNASDDGSPEMVRSAFPSVELIELDENVGFARANNIAFEHCRGSTVLLLNSDAFVHRGAVGELLRALARHPLAGAVGPRLLNEDGTLQRSAWPFPSALRLALEALGLHRVLRRIGLLEDLGTWDHADERSVDFLIGACLMLRHEALTEIEGFDEEFWLYGEEADLERRLHDRGWDVILTPSAVVTHVGGASSAVDAVRLRHFYSGQRRFLKKHGTPLAWPVARAALLLGSILRRRWTAARVALALGR